MPKAPEQFCFDAVLHMVPDKGGAYVIFPWDIRKIFRRGRIRIRASSDGMACTGSIVNMVVKDDNGNVAYGAVF